MDAFSVSYSYSTFNCEQNKIKKLSVCVYSRVGRKRWFGKIRVECKYNFALVIRFFRLCLFLSVYLYKNRVLLFYCRYTTELNFIDVVLWFKLARHYGSLGASVSKLNSNWNWTYKIDEQESNVICRWWCANEMTRWMAVAGTEGIKPISISHANVAFFTFKYIVFIRMDSLWWRWWWVWFFGFGLLSSHTTAGAKHDGWSMKWNHRCGWLVLTEIIWKQMN